MVNNGSSSIKLYSIDQKKIYLHLFNNKTKNKTFRNSNKIIKMHTWTFFQPTS